MRTAVLASLGLIRHLEEEITGIETIILKKRSSPSSSPCPVSARPSRCGQYPSLPHRGRLLVVLPLCEEHPDLSADLLVESKVVVEIKVCPNYRTEDEAQLLNELKATGIKVGLLINFGRTKVEFKRLVF